MNARELRDRRAQLLDEARAMVEAAESEDRNLSSDEETQYQDLIDQAGELETRINRLEAMPAVPENGDDGSQAIQAPNINRGGLGDNEIRALGAYLKKGDSGGVRSMMDESGQDGPEVVVNLPTALQMRSMAMYESRMYEVLGLMGMERRAVDSIMNITTAADGGAAVPTGFSGTIALRRNEIRLSERLGVRPVPGVGTTVNYPFENADPSVFAATAEQDDSYAQTYERDVAPVLDTKAFTLAKKTKKLALTEELMDDEDANLLAHVADSVGRGLGITHNSLLMTEVAANGTSLKTFASASAIAAGEPENVVFNDTLSYYLEEDDSIGWVIRPTTMGAIASITGNARLYAETPGGSRNREILGYPAFYSNQAAAVAASAKSMYFGNWYYVGMREDPALRFLRDPYTTDGIVYLKYSFRAVYGVLIAGAVGYGEHPTA
jgi:HK97 family phage major capsid protein